MHEMKKQGEYAWCMTWYVMFLSFLLVHLLVIWLCEEF